MTKTKYFRQDKDTGKSEEITKEKAIAKLKNYYNNTEETLDQSNSNAKLTTGFANYWKTTN